MSVREGAGPLLDNPPQPKRGDSPDGESLDTRRRFAPPTKMAGSGRLGGHREKDGGKRNGYGEAGRFALRRIFGYAAPAEPSPAKNGGERKAGRA